MSNRIYTTQFDVAAGTAIASPVSQAIVLDDVRLDAVRLIIPPGHAALTGMSIWWGGIQIAPFGTGTWFTGDNEIFDYPFDGEITARGLQLRGYNLDIFLHSFRMRWLVSDRYRGGPAAVSSPQLGGAPPAAGGAAVVSLTSDTTGSGEQLVPAGQQSGVLVPDLAGGVP